MGLTHEIRNGLRILVSLHPMNRSKQFKTKRTLKARYKIGDTLEACLGGGMIREVVHRLLASIIKDGERLLGSITPIAIALDEVTFDGIQHMPEVLGVGAIRRSLVTELEWFFSFLQEIHELVYFQ